jgi:hypothetical protein
MAPRGKARSVAPRCCTCHKSAFAAKDLIELFHDDFEPLVTVSTITRQQSSSTNIVPPTTDHSLKAVVNLTDRVRKNSALAGGRTIPRMQATSPSPTPPQ